MTLTLTNCLQNSSCLLIRKHLTNTAKAVTGLQFILGVFGSDCATEHLVVTVGAVEGYQL